MKNIWSYVAYLAGLLNPSPVSRDTQQPLLPLNESSTHQDVNARLNGSGNNRGSTHENHVVPHHANTLDTSFRPATAGPWDGNEFGCDYGVDWEPCSTPEDRSCWIKYVGNDNSVKIRRYDTKIDYENDVPPGRDVVWNIDVNEIGEINADGIPANKRQIVGDKYPGPLLAACWGDKVTAKVTNNLVHNGTAIHMHGVRQHLSTNMDGVPGVTQCPIAPNDTFEYKFTVKQYGTSWYHSHYSVQYANGVLGPLTFHGPTSTNWDEVKEPILMTDWFHNSAFEAIHNMGEAFPSILINGRGDITKHKYKVKDKDGRDIVRRVTPTRAIPPKYSLTFAPRQKGQKAKRYLLRLINTSFDSTFVFSIDNHKFQIVSADFVPVNAGKLRDHVVIGIGQRYNIVVEAKPIDQEGKEIPAGTEKSFWIRTTVVDCFKRGHQQDDDFDQTGVLRYFVDDVMDPLSKRWPVIQPDDTDLLCRDEADLTPTHPWNIGHPANGRGSIFGEEFSARFYRGTEKRPYPLGKWSLDTEVPNQKKFIPLEVDYTDPVFLKLNKDIHNPNDFEKSLVVIPEDFNENHWIYLALTGLDQRSDPTDNVVAHPMHLHGHDFAVLRQEYHAPFPTTLEEWAKYPLNRDNPVRRDVVLLPRDGWVVVAFKPDNPGIWILHCHIAFHASEGLALQIIERQSAANDHWKNTPAAPDPAIVEANRVCERWRIWQSDCKNHWPGEKKLPATQPGGAEGVCYPACWLGSPQEREHACPTERNIFKDDSGI